MKSASDINNDADKFEADARSYYSDDLTKCWYFICHDAPFEIEGYPVLEHAWELYVNSGGVPPLERCSGKVLIEYMDHTVSLMYKVSLKRVPWASTGYHYTVTGAEHVKR